MSPREIRSYRTQAIILGHIEYGEADRILKVFTFQKGKITAIAKGVRRIRSRKAGHLEPFTRVTLLLAKGRNMDIVTQAETVDNYSGLREDLQRIGYASYVVEVLDRFTYEEGQNVAIFRLLANTLKRLEAHPNPATVVHYYELRLLDLVGFRPQLFECVDCGKPVQAVDQFFSPLAGGVACPHCGRARPEAWSIGVDTLRYFRHLQRSNWDQVAGIEIPSAIEPVLADLIQRYISYILERQLNTPHFIKEIQRNNKNGEI
ncbi:DNA repair protein RecO [Chloroflexota bacterium]|nr:DNA repair protein RecO [Chloroflexota bacterium]